MNKKLVELTKKGDPMIRVQLPAAIIQELKSNAKESKRTHQDQFIKMIANTFKNETAFTTVFEKILPDLKNVY